jgi:hypothetical protein
MATGMRFRETMSGTWRRAGVDGAGPDGPISFDVLAELPELVTPFASVTGRLTGTFDCAGLATASPAAGTIEVSPVRDRRIRYLLEFADDDGRPCRFDGWKSIDWLHALSTWTTLPGSIYGHDDMLIGTATLRFHPATLVPFLASMRVLRQGAAGEGASGPAGGELEARRSEGKPGRLEVWYDTLTDPATGTGIWLHHEIVTPSDGSEAQARGWAAVFPAGAPPEWHRFGPEAPAGTGYFQAGEVVAEPGLRRGSAGPFQWDLRYEDLTRPLYTFPAATWHREILPGAQMLPSPAAIFKGTFRAGGTTYELAGAPGAAARIFGHGNAARWAWLHADLGAGDVLEIVAAVSHRPGLDRLRALPMVQLRLGGTDWPANPLAGAVRFRCEPALPTWRLEGRVGDRRLRVTVTLPEERCVTIGYTDPDGSTATCTNSERADASVLLEQRSRSTWRLEREWRLDGTAHSEVGTRP